MERLSNDVLFELARNYCNILAKSMTENELETIIELFTDERNLRKTRNQPGGHSAGGVKFDFYEIEKK